MAVLVLHLHNDIYTLIESVFHLLVCFIKFLHVKLMAKKKIFSIRLKMIKLNSDDCLIKNVSFLPV